MKLTNRFGVPEPIVNAIKNDPYSRGDSDISVTQLISPPRVVTLQNKHQEIIEEDASDRIYSLLGQSIHTILERANSTGTVEERMSVVVEGWKVSGAIDRDENGLIQDYKVTTAYKFKDGKAPKEHEEQLNINAEIRRQNGKQVRGLQVIAILRDWSKLEARRDPEYPQSQWLTIDVPMWPPYVAAKFLRERVILHQQSRVELPYCSPEERWARPDQFAVMKEGQARAVKLFTDETEARTYALTNPKYSVVKRPGESIRCAAYCNVASLCDQNQLLRDHKISLISEQNKEKVSA